MHIFMNIFGNRSIIIYIYISATVATRGYFDLCYKYSVTQIDPVSISGFCA